MPQNTKITHFSNQCVENRGFVSQFSHIDHLKWFKKGIIDVLKPKSDPREHLKTWRAPPCLETNFWAIFSEISPFWGNFFENFAFFRFRAPLEKIYPKIAFRAPPRPTSQGRPCGWWLTTGWLLAGC